MARLMMVLALSPALLCGCVSHDEAVTAAEESIRSQVAADLQVEVIPQQTFKGIREGEFWHVCGVARLNRPGPADSPLTMNQEMQRFITTFRRDNSTRGATLFDGSSDAEGKAAFERQWAERCPG